MKGLSAIVGAIIVIAITVIIAGIFMNWSTGLVKTQQSSATNKTYECRPGVDVSVDEVFLDFAANKSRIIVLNSGTEGQSIQSALLLNKRGQAMANLTQFPIPLPRGQVQTVEFLINGTNNMTACTDFSKAVVSTGCVEAELDTRFKAAQCVS